MSKGKAFFSTLPGVISALAGLVTVIVGVLAIASQLGWLGGDDDGDGGTASSTTVGAAAGGAGGAGTGGAAGGGSATSSPAGTLSVTPRDIEFVALGAKTEAVTATAVGGPVTMRPPEVTGADRARFAARSVDCPTAPTALVSGRSCKVEVVFSPNRAGRYDATLVLQPTSGSAVEVTIEGNHLL